LNRLLRRTTKTFSKNYRIFMAPQGI
jgi:hypothetical protein